MPGRIRRTFQSLYRALQLQPASLDFELEDTVVPVVLLHDHCEGEFVGGSTRTVGAFPSGTLVGSGVLTAGSYSVWISFQAQIALPLAAGSTNHVEIELRRGTGTFLRSLTQWTFGTPGQLQVNQTMVIQKLHIDEGQSVVLSLGSATLVNDILAAGMVIQPV